MRDKPLAKLFICVAALSLILMFALFSVHGQAQQANDMGQLAPDQASEREIAGGEVHLYSVELKANEFFQVRVEQKGVDVELKLLDLNHNVLATMDSPNGKAGPETLSFVADKSGSFVLEVKAPDAKATKGTYLIHREPSSVATTKDKRRAEVERLFAGAIRELGVKGHELSALKQLSQAEAGWKELADDYMEKMTAQLVITRGLSNDLENAGNLLDEGQKLAARSKADSIIARTRLEESLRVYRALDIKLADRELIEKASQLGAMSQPTLNHLKALQFFSKQGEGLSLNGIAQIYNNLGRWQDNVDYQNLSVVAYEDAIKLLTSSDIAGLNQKRNLLNLRYAKASSLASIGGILNTRLGKPEEALKYLNPALEQIQALYQETQDPQLRRREALTLYQIGSAHTSSSKDRKKGIEFFSKAIEIYRTLPNRKAEIAMLLMSIGAQYAVEFNYEAALKNWDDALEIYRELDNKAGQMDVLQFKGLMYNLINNKPKSREAFSQVLSILQSPDYPESLKRTFHSDSTVDTEVLEELDRSLIEYTRLDRIGFAYQELEDYQKAIEYYERALSVARDQKEQIVIRGALRSIGFIYSKLEKWERAHEDAEQALEISRNLNVKEDLARDLTDVGIALTELGKPEEALKYQNEALALFQASNVDGGEVFSPSYSLLLDELGRSYGALKNRRLAIFYGKQGVNAIQGERQRLRNFDAAGQKGFLGKKEKHYRRLAGWLIDENRLDEAVQVLNLLRDQEFFDFNLDTSQPARQANLTSHESVTMSTLQAASQRVATAEQLLITFRRRFGTRQPTADESLELKRLEADSDKASADWQVTLKTIETDFSEPASALTSTNKVEDVPDVRDMQSALVELRTSTKQKTAALYTLIGEDKFNIIVIHADGELRSFESPIRAADLDKKILQFYAVLQSPTYDPRPLGKELYDIILKPVETELNKAGVQTLMWQLDGNLRYLPMAALFDGKKYLVERFQNVVFTRADSERMTRAVSTNWTGTGFGSTQAHSVDLLGDGTKISFDALPGVTAELRSIFREPQVNKKPSRRTQGILNGDVFVDAKFSKSAFYDATRQRRPLVHISSHFAFQPGDDSRSFLLLGDGTALTLNELKKQTRLFDGVELLTLSACNTALQKANADGREIDGFAELAQRLGAGAVMATLWSVSDNSTPYLMREFYRFRESQEGKTKAAGLREAQLALLNGTARVNPVSSQSPATKGTSEATLRIVLTPPTAAREDGPRRDTTDVIYVTRQEAPPYQKDPAKPFAHPYYWSPFVLFGNWR
jgi:CHAT domain-containing protein/tetratricopeptide (TPR) repeat protein